MAKAIAAALMKRKRQYHGVMAKAAKSGENVWRHGENENWRKLKKSNENWHRAETMAKIKRRQ
jgi:hypothetical protein